MRTRMSVVAPSLCLLLLCAACATAPRGEVAATGRPGISPADLISSIADVAAGRNPAMREAGIYLKSVEFNLLVATEDEVGGKTKIVIVDAEASRKSEISFLQTFVLEVPPAPRKTLAGVTLPQVRSFVETAMEAARDLALAAAREGLPQRLDSVELVAKIVVSRKGSGGISFSIPAVAGATIGAGLTRSIEDTNTIKLVFLRAP
ncbi:MAG: trypco2 family protein [Thermoanaerobaculia bacterium]